MVDSHCHLADEAYAADLADVIQRARSGGVSEVLCVIEASDRAEAERLPAVKALWPGLRTATGIHPHRAIVCADDPAEAGRLTERCLASDSSVRAIGEIGLDYHYDLSPRDVQRAVFASQVRLARHTHLPVVIHTREAEADTFAILESEGGGEVGGIFHCFSGDPAMAARAVAMGFHVSFSGIVTFPKAAAIREAALVVPLDRVLAETDGPYLAPVPQRGKRNEPAWVRYVVECLASLRGMGADEMDAVITANFRALIRPPGANTPGNGPRIAASSR
jgi:TatD DNase family protein